MRKPLVLWLLVAQLALTACGGVSDQSTQSAVSEAQRVPLSELEVMADPKSYEGPSTAIAMGEAFEPLEKVQQKLPVTVDSYNFDLVEKVKVSDASRIIALDSAGAIATTIWNLGFGDSLVGRDISTDFPGADELPVVTSSGHSVNAEVVLALRPTLIITDGSIGPRDVVQQLADTGVTIVFVKNTRSFAGAAQMAEHVAQIIGVPQSGETLAANIEKRVEQTKSDIAAIAPRDENDKLRMLFLYIRGQGGIYYLFGEDSGAGDLISSLGGVDVAKELGWSEMKPMTDEAIVAGNPDLILVMSEGLKSTGGVAGLLATKPAIALTNAGKNKRFVDMDDSTVLSFGPRSHLVLDALARAIYAPESK